MQNTITDATSAPQPIQDWVQISDTYSQGWEFFKANWKLVLKFAGMAGLLLYGPQMLVSFFSSAFVTEETSILVSVIMFAISIWQMIVGMGVIVVFLKLIRKSEGEFQFSVEDFFSVTDKFWTYLWANIRYSLIVMLGFILFLIPGIIWSIKYMYVPYLVLDKSLDTNEAFKASADMTDGIKWQLIGFSLVGGLIGIAGMLALGIGLLVAMPVVYIATFMLYDRLLARA